MHLFGAPTELVCAEKEMLPFHESYSACEELVERSEVSCPAERKLSSSSSRHLPLAHIRDRASLCSATANGSDAPPRLRQASVATCSPLWGPGADLPQADAPGPKDTQPAGHAPMSPPNEAQTPHEGPCVPIVERSTSASDTLTSAVGCPFSKGACEVR